MTPPPDAVIGSLALAALIAAGWGGRKKATKVWGVLTRDSKGRLALLLQPAKSKRKRKK